MRKSLSAVMLAAVCCGCLVSCNEKPRSYKFVKVAHDGNEQVEKFEASNDTAALKIYFDRMEKIIVDNINKQAEPFKAMYVISPDGDTLNTNEELLKTMMSSIPTVIPAAQAPAQEQPGQE